jgi:hypothetical protein
MSAKFPIKPSSPSAVFGSDAAPVIYFDGVVAFGIRDGVIQLELGTNQLVPVTLEGTQVKTKIVIAAHLRCTTQTATNLMEIIEQLTTAPPPIKQ